MSVTRSTVRRHCWVVGDATEASAGADPAEEIWRKWGDDLMRYATALVGPDEAGDVVGDAFVRVIPMAEQKLAEGTLTLPYLLRVVLNEVRMRHRGRRRRELREWRVALMPEHVELLAQPEVRQAVDRLSVMQRAVVFLTYWDDLPPAAVADRLGVSEGTVKRHLARARSRLRKVLT